MTKFHITTLGCKVNQCESETLTSQLIQAGHDPAANPGKADLFVINTCAVTSRAAMQSRQAVRRLLRLRPGAQVVVTGCSVQTDPEAFQQIPGVTHLTGTEDKGTIVRALSHAREPNDTTTVHGIGDLSPSRVTKPLDNPFPGPSGPRPPSIGRTRGFFKIQDGCNSFCTYCIVPHARGRSRSLPVDDVMDGLSRYGAAGYKEVVLTGIHLGQWGRDLDPSLRIVDLIHRIGRRKPLARIRLSSIEPQEMSDGLISGVARWAGFARHFHIPLQSGDDGVLRRMGRPYTRDQFRRRILQIHDTLPDAGIGVDVMVGFPGEDEGAFQNTFDLIRDLPVTYLHVFPFSPRPGTPAHGFDQQVPSQVSKARAARMRTLGAAKQRRFLTGLTGHTMEVLVTGPAAHSPGLLEGLTGNYAKISFPGDGTLRNELVQVKASHLDGKGRLKGHLA